MNKCFKLNSIQNWIGSSNLATNLVFCLKCCALTKDFGTYEKEKVNHTEFRVRKRECVCDRESERKRKKSDRRKISDRRKYNGRETRLQKIKLSIKCSKQQQISINKIKVDCTFIYDAKNEGKTLIHKVTRIEFDINNKIKKERRK